MATTMQALAYLHNGDLVAYICWTAAHDVFYGVFTPFMFVAKLMVLDRIFDSQVTSNKQHVFSSLGGSRGLQ
jgi:hypothetical protein